MPAGRRHSISLRGRVAWIALFAIYASVVVLRNVASAVRWIVPNASAQRSAVDTRSGNTDFQPVDLICIGTFYNEGWLVSHAQPMLASDAVDSVTVVTDQPLTQMPGVRYLCPSQRMTRLLGRSASRVVAACRAGRQSANPVFVGYHIMPNALIALLCGRLFKALSVYQMTGGAVQVAGGGYQSENRLLAMLDGPSPLLERLLFNIVRSFDVVLVRGETARGFVEDTIGHTDCHVLTGSVDLARFAAPDTVVRDPSTIIDVLSVGRLAPVKGVENLVAALGAVQPDRPNLRATLVGDGPLREALEQQASSLGLEHNLSFAGASNAVATYLHRSRLFVLPSVTEGLSIAMLEAMAAGVPVVVTDVGELRPVVEAADCGIVLKDHSISTLAAALGEALDDEARRQQWSRNASRYAATHFSTAAVATKWSQILGYETCVESLPTASQGCSDA